MSHVLGLRLLVFAITFTVLLVFDACFIPAQENQLFVPKPVEVFRAQQERKERARKQKETSLLQAVEVEKAVTLLDGVLEGLHLDPSDPIILSRLEKLKAKVGDTGGPSAELLSESQSSAEEEDLEENEEGEESENGEVVKKPAMVKPTQPIVNNNIASTSQLSSLESIKQRLLQIEDPTDENWAKLRASETFESLANEVETWIGQGKTKRLGFDVFYDPLSGTSELVRSKKKASNSNEEEKIITEAPKAEPGDAQRRWISRPKPNPPVAMQAFIQNLRSTRTYSHMSKAVDTERKLKTLGYKQSTVGSKVKPIFQGNFGETCPHFDEKQISFCNYYLPTYREQEQQQLLQMQERALRSAIPNFSVESFFPLTWRLYKQLDRRNLRTRTQNESLPSEGGPYVNKFSFQHGAGKPSLTQKMYNQLKKSDESNKMQVQEAKQKMIVQVYCNNPYLFEGKKFIIRTWAVILSANPMIVLYHDGALLRSVVPYSPFTKRDAHYKRAGHFTNDQSTHKGTLRSSSLYASLGQFQHWLNAQHKETPTFVRDSLRPRIKARMIYALYAMMRPSPRTQADEMDEEDEGGGGDASLVASGKGEPEVIRKQTPQKIPADVAIVQPVCFDFLLQEGGHNLWLLGAHTTGACAVNLGGDSFRPPWKVAMQTALADKLVELSEEMLWRKVANVKLSSITDLFTDVPLDVLIDETLPGWSYIDEINWHLGGGHVDGGPGSKDIIEGADSGGGDQKEGNGGSEDGKDEASENSDSKDEESSSKEGGEEEEEEIGGDEED